MEKKIKKLISEIINGKEKSLPKLKKLYQDFFKGKTQKELDKVNKKFLNSLRDSYDRITKKEKLTEIDKADLDYLFNKPLSKYICLEIETEINDAKLKRFARVVCEESSYRDVFGQKVINNFLAFIADVWISDNFSCDLKLESDNKDFLVEITFFDYEEKTKMYFFGLGDKKYKPFLEKIQEVLEDEKQ